MGKHTERLELIAIDKLIPYANNARTHSDEQIKKIQASLREFGFVNPVLIDKDCGIIAGHGRVEAAKREGMTEVPCVWVEHLTEAQKKAYILADNRLALDAGWDMEVLKVELAGLQDIDFNIDLTGFNSEELSDIFGEEELEAVEDDYEVELPEEPKTKLGDIYQLGRHRLICGDSTDPKVIHKLMDGARVDLFLTDPPYNVDYEGKTKDRLKIKNDTMADDDFRQFLRDAFLAADDVMKGGAVFYIWHADLEGYNFRGACHDIGWEVRQCLVWNKNSMVMGRQDYHWKHEPCLYGWKSGAGHLWSSDRKQTTILNFDRPSKSENHPTMKPVKLFDYQIQNNTKSEDIVLDTFAGSGTTVIACEQNGRTAYCCELDPKYCDVIIARWEMLTGEKVVKL
jgi:DNA modification methylase